MNHKRWLHLLMDGIAFCLISSVLSYSLLRALYLPAPYLQILLRTALLYLGLTLLLHNRFTLLTGLAAAALAYWPAARWLLPEGWWRILTSYGFWLTDYIHGIALLEPNWVSATLWAVTGVFAVLLYVLLLKLRWFLPAVLLSTALVVVLWYYGHDHVLTSVWWLALGYTLVWGGIYHRSLSMRYQMPDYGLWQLCALPLAALIILTAYWIVPEDTRGMRWSALVRTVDRIERRISDRYGFSGARQPFRLSDTGFPSASDQLGGPVQLSGDHAMTVKAPYPLYLRGTLLNEYTGSGWTDTIEDMRYRFTDQNWRGVRQRAFDFHEPAAAALSPADMELFFPRIEAQITHIGIHTSTLFHVLRLEDLVPVHGAFVPYFNAKGETFTTRLLEAEESYFMTVRVPNLGHEGFRRFLREASGKIDFREPLPDLGEGETYQDALIALQQHYMGIPETVPQRVYDLAEELTAGLTTQFDRITAIQRFLIEQFGYTLVPPYTPLERDFVDYFLFDLQEGYCTYFATAMAVLGRAAGIPTRYVEGFLMPSVTDQYGIYEVRNLNAHAWVEVYFPRVGWIPMDPTPPVLANLLPAGNILPGMPGHPYWEDFLREFMEGYPGGFPPFPGDMTPIAAPEPAPRFDTTHLLFLLFGVLAALLLALAAALLLRRWRLARLPFDQQFHYYYREIQWLLGLYGAPIEPGETPYAYAARIDIWLVPPAMIKIAWLVHQEKEITMTDVSKLLVKSTFGTERISVWDRDKAMDFYLQLRKDLVKVLGLPLYLMRWLFRMMSGGRAGNTPIKIRLPAMPSVKTPRVGFKK